MIAHADEVKGVVGENLRKALDWLPTGRTLVTVKTRRRRCPSRSESLVDRGADEAKLAALYERFGFRTLREELGKDERAPERAPAIRARAEAARRAGSGGRNFAFLARARAGGRRRPSSTRATTRPSSTTAALERWVAKLEAARARLRRHRDHEPRPDARAARRHLVLRSTPGEAAYIPLAPPLRRRARRSLPVDAVLAR